MAFIRSLSAMVRSLGVVSDGLREVNDVKQGSSRSGPRVLRCDSRVGSTASAVGRQIAT
jgi:hypothetical protein